MLHRCGLSTVRSNRSQWMGCLRRYSWSKGPVTEEQVAGQLSFLTAHVLLPASASSFPSCPQSLPFNWPRWPERALLSPLTRWLWVGSQGCFTGTTAWKSKEETDIVEFEMARSSGLLQCWGRSRGWDCGRDFQRWHLSVWAQRGPHHFQGHEGTVLPARVATTLSLGPPLLQGWRVTAGWGHRQSDGDKTGPQREDKSGQEAVRSPCLVSLCPLGSLVGVVCRVSTQLWLKSGCSWEMLTWGGQQTQGTVADFCPWGF